MKIACAVCVAETAGAARPPAVTIHEGTALCVEHLLNPKSGGSGS